jgi:hypothetical protein
LKNKKKEKIIILQINQACTTIQNARWMNNLEFCSRNIKNWIENAVKIAQIKSLRTNIDKIAKFGNLILTNKGLFKKKVEYGRKIAN